MSINNKTRILIEPGYALVRVFSDPVERDIPLYLRRDQYVRTYGAAINSFGEVEIQGAVSDSQNNSAENMRIILSDGRDMSREFMRLGYPVLIWRHNNGRIVKDARKPGDRNDDEIIKFLMS